MNPAFLVGAETGDRAPNGVTAMFRHARANGVALPKVHHRRVGRTAHVLVSRFNHEKDFAVLFR